MPQPRRGVIVVPPWVIGMVLGGFLAIQPLATVFITEPVEVPGAVVADEGDGDGGVQPPDPIQLADEGADVQGDEQAPTERA